MFTWQIFHDEGHRRIQIKTNELCWDGSSKFTCILFGSTSLPPNSERACCDEQSMCPTHLENSSRNLCALALMLQRRTDCRRQLMFGGLRVTEWKKAIASGNCRRYVCWIRLKACGFVECALEMPDELLLIANVLFMWFTKPSLK